MSHKHYSDYNVPGAPARFEADHFGNDVGRYFNSLEYQRIRSYIRPIGATVLDVGTGTGRLSIPLAREGACVTAVDASEQMLNYARSRAVSPSNPAFLRCDAHALPFADRRFHCVLSIRTLMHFERWQQVLSELCRVARDRVIVDAPATFGMPIFEATFDAVRRLVGFKIRPYQTFRLSELEQAFHRNGFRILEFSKQFVLPIKLHRKINALQYSILIERHFRSLGLTRLLGSPLLVAAERLALDGEHEGNARPNIDAVEGIDLRQNMEG